MTERPMRSPACAHTADCAGYVLGELSASEFADLEQHLLEGCSRCASELERLRRSAAQLDLAAGAQDPPAPARLRDRVLAGLSAVRAGGVQFADRDERQAIEREAIAVVAANETPWQPTDVPGIDVRVLSIDREARTVATLMRLAPGATYPSHRHRGREHSYVVEGDLRFGGRVLTAGDHMVAVEGSVHTELSSRDGCIALVTSCLDDEQLA
ncbi:cupin domain-containing protein [Engelhardtia mirabilis]|uniref:ChrR Cupin-like domain protein n=1 Tax=Engelhardtia mirabilis TaxID=2528011 RepID=A0A518BDQ5_9BACT|nr:ChrR Cupin-like domain protein [Planctomycetes bacterium Pla133]QDU99441.1 ChrR Cupin-like domain protein [Planctomycetes bacterium Pla86]